jgi:hypothetical protein
MGITTMPMNPHAGAEQEGTAWAGSDLTDDEPRGTQAEPAGIMMPRRERAFARRLAALPVAILAFLLLVLAVPRTVGVLVAARAEPVLRKLQDLQPVQVDELRTLIAALEDGRFWRGDGRLRTDLGLAYLLLAEKLPRDDPEAGRALQAAIAALQAGLARAPANPYAWARLAYAEALARGWSPQAVSALRLSLITAPYEPRLLWSRLRMSFLAWPEMSSEDRELIFQQIRFAWRADPGELARLAQELRQVNLVRAALLRTPEDGLAFERLLKR